ncbi:hypothetical protein Bca4012_014388 [Brassica carinata]
MGNHTLRCKHGKKVRDVSLDEAAAEKAKNPPRGTRRRIKIILRRKQLELLLLNTAEGVSSSLPETYGICKRKWKPSLQTIVELMEYKFHVMVAIIVTVVVSSLVYAAPRILDIVAYFWPLFASTAAFLAMAITSGGFQQLSDEATGEGIMDYVAGRPEDFH